MISGKGFYNICSDFDCSLDFLPYGLETLKISINCENTIIGSNLPSSLKHLEILLLDYKCNANNVRINELPDSIEFLVIAIIGFDYKSISRLPSNLKTLHYYIKEQKNKLISCEEVNIFLSNMVPQVDIMVDKYF